MISKAFIFIHGSQGDFSHAFEMEVVAGPGTPEAEKLRTEIQELYQRMMGRPATVRWDFEYWGKKS